MVVKASRTLRPSGVFGLGCSERWGRSMRVVPVAEPAWLNVEWTRPVAGLTIFGQRIGVSRLQLGEFPVAEDGVDELVDTVVEARCVAHAVEGVGVHRPTGFEFPSRWRVPLVDEDGADLLAGRDVELDVRPPTLFATCLIWAISSPSAAENFLSMSVSTTMPVRCISTMTGNKGISIVSNTFAGVVSV